MNVLLTSATDFLGSKVLNSLINDYHSLSSASFKVTILKRSFFNLSRIGSVLDKIDFFDLDKAPLKELFVDRSFDLIIHCATNYGRSHESKLNTLESTLFLPLQLIELGLENGLKYFINTDTVLDKRVSEYLLSKNQFYDWFNSYHNLLTCINVKLEHLCGAFGNDTKFITKIMIELRSGSVFVDLTSGKQKRDFIYVDDVVSVFHTIIMNLDKMSVDIYNFEIGNDKTTPIKDVVAGNAFNVGGGMANSLSLLELFDYFNPKFDISLKYKNLPPRESDQLVFVADTIKIENKTG